LVFADPECLENFAVWRLCFWGRSATTTIDPVPRQELL